MKGQEKLKLQKQKMEIIKEFKKIAEEAFFSGYFLVNGGCKDAYKLKLTCIEFYYHEDDGNIKDEKNI